MRSVFIEEEWKWGRNVLFVQHVQNIFRTSDYQSSKEQRGQYNFIDADTLFWLIKCPSDDVLSHIYVRRKEIKGPFQY